MDPNNIGIVRFARAGANFPPKSSNTSSRNLGVAVGRIAVDYRSTLYSDKVPRDLNISLGYIYNPIFKQF